MGAGGSTGPPRCTIQIVGQEQLNAAREWAPSTARKASGDRFTVAEILSSLLPGDDALRMPIASLRLSVRAVNVCAELGIAVVRDLLDHDDNDLLRQPSVGRRTLSEIKTALIQRIGTPAAVSGDLSAARLVPELVSPGGNRFDENGRSTPLRRLREIPGVRPHVPVPIDRRLAARAPDIADILRRLGAADPFLDVPIKTFHLSARTSNIFRREGIERARDLLGYNDTALLDLPAFGHKCLLEVKVAVLSRLKQAAAPGGSDSANRQAQGGPAGILGVRRHVLADEEDDFESAVEAAPVTLLDPGANVIEEIRNIVDIVVPMRKLAAANTLVLRNRHVLLERYGVDGPAKTLDEIGQQYGMTRERVRQIVDKASQFAPTLLYPIDRPSHFGRLLHALRPGSTPRTRRAGDGLDDLLGPSMTLFDAARFFEDLFGLDFLSEVQGNFSHSRFGLADQEEHEILRDLRAAAVDIVDAVGAAHVDAVIGVMFNRISGKLTADQVYEILSTDRRLQALPGQDGWVCFAPPRASRFQIEAEKMLVVAGCRVDLYDLQSKYRDARSRRDAHRLSHAQQALLPFEVAKALMNQMDWARQVQSNDYVYTGSRTVEEVLTPVEYALVKTIEDLGGAGGSFEIARAAASRFGIVTGTAIMGLHMGTVTHRADYGARVIFGRPLAPVMDRLREVTKTSRAIRQSGGPFETRTTVTANYLNRNCNISIPAALWNELDDRGVTSIREEITGVELQPRRSGAVHYMLGGTALMRALSAQEGQSLVVVIDALDDVVRAFASVEEGEIALGSQTGPDQSQGTA